MWGAWEYSRKLHSTPRVDSFVICPYKITFFVIVSVLANFWRKNKKKQKTKKPLELIVTWVWLALWELEYGKKKSSVSPRTWLRERGERFHLEPHPLPGLKSCPRSPGKYPSPIHVHFFFQAHPTWGISEHYYLGAVYQASNESMTFGLAGFPSGYLQCSPVPPACRIASCVIAVFCFYKTSWRFGDSFSFRRILLYFFPPCPLKCLF